MPLPTELKPTKPQRVIDLVRHAGVDVNDWANYKRGQENPGANPKYCYEWAFVEPGVRVVLNIWYAWIVVNEAGQYYEFRGKAVSLETSPPRLMRRRRMDKAVKLAYELSLPVRMIVLDGDAPIKVSARLLDPVPWAVTQYNAVTGEFTLRRRVAASA